MKLNAEFVCHPTIFAINEEYQIVLPVKSEMLFWIRVGDKDYFDHSCGILRSSTHIHKVDLPKKELDRAKKYTVCYKKLIDRKPYFPESEETVEEVYKFRPVRKGRPLNIYHISDAHGRVAESSEAAKLACGKEIDLLILNGDISDHSSSVENISMIYKIASNITEGSLPCVSAEEAKLRCRFQDRIPASFSEQWQNHPERGCRCRGEIHHPANAAYME